VREHVEFPVDGRPGDDFQVLIAIGREVRAGERGLPDARDRALRHRLEPKALVGGAPLGGRHFAPVAFEDCRQCGSLGDAPIDGDPLVHLGFDAACPALGECLVIEGSGLRRQPGAADLHSPEIAASLEGRHWTVLLDGVSPDRATGTVPELSQKPSKATIQKMTTTQETS
jgi:hypothetical protein